MRRGRLATWMLRLGSALVVAPLVGMLSVVCLVPVGSAVGLLVGFLVLPAVATSLIGCGLVVAASRHRMLACCTILAVWFAYVALLHVSIVIVHAKEERFLQAHLEDMREIATRVRHGESTIARENQSMQERGWHIHIDEPWRNLMDACIVVRNPPDTVAFVLDGALNDLHGVAFSSVDVCPAELSVGSLVWWELAPDGTYAQWVTG